MISLASGDPEAAVANYARLCELTPDHPAAGSASPAPTPPPAGSSFPTAALADLHRRFARRIVSPYALAVAEARAGRADAAFALLERADAERDPSALLIPHDVSFADLHADPRWPALIARVRGETTRRRARAPPGHDPRSLRPAAAARAFWWACALAAPPIAFAVAASGFPMAYARSAARPHAARALVGRRGDRVSRRDAAGARARVRTPAGSRGAARGSRPPISSPAGLRRLPSLAPSLAVALGVFPVLARLRQGARAERPVVAGRRAPPRVQPSALGASGGCSPAADSAGIAANASASIGDAVHDVDRDAHQAAGAAGVDGGSGGTGRVATVGSHQTSPSRSSAAIAVSLPRPQGPPMQWPVRGA